MQVYVDAKDFVEKLHKCAYLMKYIVKRLENGPPQIMRLFLNLQGDPKKSYTTSSSALAAILLRY